MLKFKINGDNIYKFGFVLAALIFISIGLINYRSSIKVNNMDRQIRRTHNILITLDGVKEKLKNAIISHRDFLLTMNTDDLVDFRNGPAQVRLKMGRLKDLVKNDSLLYSRTLLLEESIDTKFDALETSVNLKLNGASIDSVNRFMNEYARKSLDRIRVLTGEIVEIENARLRSLTLIAEDSIRVSRIYIVAGNMIAFVILFLSFALLNRQIQTRRMAEQSLKEQMERLEVVTGNIGAGLSIITRDLKIVWMNKVMKSIFGEKLEGKSFTRAYPAEENTENINGSSSLLTSDGSQIHEERILMNAMGQKNWYQLIYSPMQANNGNQPVFLQLLIPIDERKAMEKSLQSAKEKAEESSRAKSEFLANMSHEIRTPMNAILGFTEILKEKLPERQALNEYLHGIEVNGKTLVRIIDDILDLSKIEAGKMKIHKEMVDPRHLIEEIRAMFQVRAKQKGLDLRIITSDDLPEGMELDETRIRQVLFNLVGNAMKFTNAGFIELSFRTLKQHFNEDSTDLLIQVRDTGLGIPREQQELIFQPFHQQSGQDSRLYGGTGLGLTITRRLLEMMGGTISLESTVDEGSNFIIMLPGVKTGRPAITPMKDTSAHLRGVKFRDAKILLVEDKESNRKVVRDFLGSLKIHLLEAANGKEGVQLALKTHPQLILMDLQMPVMNGFEAVDELRKFQEFRGVPVIALTASAMKESRTKIKMSFEDFLIKPVTKQTLVQKLTNYLPYDYEPSPDEKAEEHDGFEARILKFNTDNVLIPESLKKLFRDELHPAYDDIRRKQSVNRIRQFAVKIRDAGKKYEIRLIEDYGNELIRVVETFHTEKIAGMLNLFPSIEKHITGV